MRRKLFLVVLAGFLIGALGGAAALILARGGAPQIETSGAALIGGPFTLVDKDGKTVTDQDFRGRYMLVFFGFTHCPDICPTELQAMATALDQITANHEQNATIPGKLVPVFVTLDPERDTPKVVGDYVKNFGPYFVGLTGTPAQVAAAAKAYRIFYSKNAYKDDAGNQTYTIDHSAIVYLIGPDGKYIAHFAYGTSPDKMAETLKRYL
jgi:protein SCO1/2